MQVAQGINVKTVMDTWINQKGYPVIEIKNNGINKKKATQTRFLDSLNPSDEGYEKEAKGLKWYVPLTWVTSKSPNQPSTTWMNMTSATFNVPSGIKWIKANYKQTGVYRVNYDASNWRNLIQQLNDDHTVFLSTERSGLIDDALNLARAKLLDLKIALGVTSYLRNERYYTPFATAVVNLNYIGDMLGLRLAHIKFQKYMKQLAKPLLSYVGWENTGGLLKTKLRDSILILLGYHGDQDVIDECLRKFRAWMKDDRNVIASHLRDAVYQTAVKYGGRREWTFLWRKYQTTIDPVEKNRFVYALSSTLNISLRKRLLRYTLDANKVKGQDVDIIISYVAAHAYGRCHTWKFFKKNFKQLINRSGKDDVHKIARMFTSVTSSFNEQPQLCEVEAFVKLHKDVLGDMRAAKQAVEKIRTNIAWMRDNEQSVSDFLIKKTDELEGAS